MSINTRCLCGQLLAVILIRDDQAKCPICKELIRKLSTHSSQNEKTSWLMVSFSWIGLSETMLNKYFDGAGIKGYLTPPARGRSQNGGF